MNPSTAKILQSCVDCTITENTALRWWICYTPHVWTKPKERQIQIIPLQWQQTNADKRLHTSNFEEKLQHTFLVSGECVQLWSLSIFLSFVWLAKRRNHLWARSTHQADSTTLSNRMMVRLEASW